MNCKEAQDLLIDYLYGEVSSGQARSLEEHGKSCKECSRLMSEYARIRGLTAGLTEPRPDQMVVNRIVAVARDEADKARSSLGFGWLKILATLCIMAVVGSLVYYQTRTGLITQETGVRLRRDESPLTLSPGPMEPEKPSVTSSEARPGMDQTRTKEAAQGPRLPVTPIYPHEPPEAAEMASTEATTPPAPGGAGDLTGKDEAPPDAGYDSYKVSPRSDVADIELKQDRLAVASPAMEKDKGGLTADAGNEPALLEEKPGVREKRTVQEEASRLPKPVQEEEVKGGEPGPVSKLKPQAAPRADSESDALAKGPPPAKESHLLQAQAPEPQEAWKGREGNARAEKSTSSSPIPVVGFDDDHAVDSGKPDSSEYMEYGDRGGDESVAGQTLKVFSEMAKTSQTPPPAPSTANHQQDDLRLGRQALDEGQYYRAKTIFRDLLKRVKKGHPDRPAVLLGLARAYEGLGSREAAKYTYERLAKESPEHRSLASEKIRELR